MKDREKVLTLSYLPTFSEFLAELGVHPKGLGSQLLEGVYDDLFTSSTNLRQEYIKYYSVEYPTFKDYLEVAHEIYLSDEHLEKEYILLINGLSGIVDPIYDDNQLDTIISKIKRAELRHES